MFTVKRLFDMNEVLQLVPIECRLREKEKTPVRTNEFLAFVQSALQNELFYLVGIYDGENIAGYLAALVIPINLMDMKSVNILRVWYDHRYRKTEIRDLGWQIITEIAKIHGVKKVRFEARRGIKAYERTWKFKAISTVMERRI